MLTFRSEGRSTAWPRKKPVRLDIVILADAVENHGGDHARYSDMADSLIALHNHIASAYERRYFTSPGPAIFDARRGEGEEDSRIVVLLTAWSILLFRMSGQTEMLIGVHRNGRMLPIRASLKGSPSAHDLVVQCRRELARAEQSHDWNFSVLRFQLTFGPVAEPSRPFQLHLHANITGEGVSLRCDYDQERYDAQSAGALLERYRRLLGAMAADPAMPVGNLLID